MPGQGYNTDAIETLTDELRICRRRGLEQLDKNSHNQLPVSIPLLGRIASEFAVAHHYEVPGRIAQIKNLLRHAIDALEAEDPPHAAMLRGLYFGDSNSTF